MKIASLRNIKSLKENFAFGTETGSGHAAEGPCTDEVAYVLDEELRK